MKTLEKRKKYLNRFVITALVALVFVAIINEGAHFFQKESTDRPAETVELVIPAGTAERVAAGEAEPEIPTEMSFVVGDTLLVSNHDSVDHELGPLFIPAGASASLQMEDANKYALGCSFQPTRYLGLDVKSRTTAASRLQAFLLATPPTAMFFFLYSLLIFPLDGRKPKNGNHQESAVQP